ncbi:histidine--tRNA ligase [Buchnera aphidicola]
MHDYIPDDVITWQYIEYIVKRILKNYCYNEIRFPLIEKTSLFAHSIGNITDIIEKEMYSFKDKKNKKITLRPEGTIGCMRACINKGLLRTSKQKLWYLGPMFRYERPQHGRYRQFHQFGIEVLGMSGPDIDLEIILLVERILRTLNISNYVQLELNSIGSYESRLHYKKILFSYFKQYEACLDEDCKRRLYVNPLRILDSKDKNIKAIINNAPILMDFIDDNSLIHFENLCKLMKNIGISYVVNYKLVRGLDYYNKTVFEWKTNLLGAKDAICAGGRYDNLSKSLGVTFIPAIGCAIGMERLVLLIKSLKLKPKTNNAIDVFIIFLKDNIQIEAIKLSELVRTQFPKKKIMLSILSSNLRKQFSTANKIKARIVLLLGPNEVKNNLILLKDLTSGYQKSFLKNKIIEELELAFKN